MKTLYTSRIMGVSIPPLETYLTNFLGVESFIQKLNTNLETGLTGADFPERTEHFGNNYRAPLVVKPFCIIFKDALDDFMLKLLIVCASFSITFDMLLAAPHDRSHGKWN